jgi:hypothetical protein
VFLSAAAGVLVLGLGTGLLASYMGFQNLLVLGADGPDELAYVPTDTQFVAYANVRDVMDSELRRRLSETQPNTANGAGRFKEQTGIDIETDIDYVVAASASGDGTSSLESQGPPLVLARGRFDRVRIEGFVRQDGGVVADYKGARLLENTDKKFALVFLEPGLIAIGSPATVRQAIDTKEGSANATRNADLMRLIKDVRDGNAWAVARFDEMAGNRLPPEVASQLPPISWFSASGFVDGGVRGRLRVEARDEASAQSLQDVIRGFMALARLQGGQHPELTELLNSLQLTGEGKAVSLSFAVPPEVIDALGAMRAQRPRPPRPPAAPEPPQPPVQPAL